MNNFTPDKIILGHNQFFGTNHLSNEKGAESARYFGNIENAINIIRFAYNNGATGLMLSTHENSKEILDSIRNDKELRENLNIYVLLPYLAKYVRLANEQGMVKMVSELIGNSGWKERLGILSQGGIGVIKKDISGMLKTLIDIELLPFKDVCVKAIFLHNSLSDLIIGMKMIEIISFFSDYIVNNYQVSPGYCTLNSSLLQNFFNENNIINPLIMAPFNPLGFQMNPSRKSAETSLREFPSLTIAMSILASGYIKPLEAYQYISKLKEINSIVVGASSKNHLKEIFKYFT